MPMPIDDEEKRMDLILSMYSELWQNIKASQDNIIKLATMLVALIAALSFFYDKIGKVIAVEILLIFSFTALWLTRQQQSQISINIHIASNIEKEFLNYEDYGTLLDKNWISGERMSPLYNFYILTYFYFGIIVASSLIIIAEVIGEKTINMRLPLGIVTLWFLISIYQNIKQDMYARKVIQNSPGIFPRKAKTTLCRTLLGHSAAVKGAAITSDGTRVISASSDKTLKVWDIESGIELRTLNGHNGPVNAIAVTSDCTRAVSASSDKTLKVWDIESGIELKTLNGHSGSVNAIAVTYDCTRAISASSDKTLKVWDLECGIELRTLKGHLYPIKAMAISNEGDLAVSVAIDNVLKIWDTTSGKELRSIKVKLGYSRSITDIIVISEEKIAISSGSDNILRIWDLKNGDLLKTLKGHAGFLNAISAIALMPGGRYIIVGSNDNTVSILDLSDGAEIGVLRGHDKPITDLSISIDGNKIVSASEDKTLKIWYMKNINY
jgi:WD40 repeat protein